MHVVSPRQHSRNSVLRPAVQWSTLIVIKFGKLKLYNNILSQDLEANKTIRFLSKDIKQYIQGNKLHLKGNKILGLLIFLLVSRSPQNIRPMRWALSTQWLLSWRLQSFSCRLWLLPHVLRRRRCTCVTRRGRRACSPTSWSWKCRPSLTWSSQTMLAHSISSPLSLAG